MEELKNLKNFNEFKDSLNEELLLGAIKNLFNKLFSKMDKKLATAVQMFTDKIDKSQNWETSVKAFEDSTKIRMNAANEGIQKAAGPLGVRKMLVDSSQSLFLELQVLYNKYQSSNLAAKNIFKGDEMFNKNSSEEFSKGIFESINAKMIELNKTSQAGYNEEQLKEYLTKNTDINQTENIDQQQQQQIKAEKKSYLNYNKIYEDVPIYNAQNLNQSNSNQANTDNQNNQTNTGNQNNTMLQGNINNLKNGSIKWLNENLYGLSLKKIKEIKAPTPATGGSDPFDSIAKNSKATGNSQNLAKLLRNIVNIPDTNTLAKVRDAIADARGIDKNKFIEEIGKF